MAMTDDNRHSAAAEAECRAIEERVTQTTIRLLSICCAGMSSYFRLFFASSLDRVFSQLLHVDLQSRYRFVLLRASFERCIVCIAIVWRH